MIWEIAFEFIIYGLLLYKYEYLSLFFSILTFDTICSAYQFIWAYFESLQEESTVKQVILDLKEKTTYAQYLQNSILYTNIVKYIPDQFNEDIITEISFVDKYIYFFTIMGLNIILNIFTWFNYSYEISRLLLILACPSILSVLCRTKCFLIIDTFVLKEAKRLYLYILCKITAKIINSLSKVCLDCKPNIDYKELENFYENTNESTTYILNFVQTFVLMCFVHYMKKSNNIFYKFATKIIYKIKTIGQNTDDNKINKNVYVENKTKNMLAQILYAREWNKLCNPQTVNKFFELYEDDANKDNGYFVTKINEILYQLNYDFVKLFVILTLISINEWVGAISVVLLSLKYIPYIKNGEWIVSVVTSLLLILLTTLKITGSVIVVFAYILSPIVWVVLTYFYKRDYKMFTHYHDMDGCIFIPIVVWLFGQYSLFGSVIVFVLGIGYLLNGSMLGFGVDYDYGYDNLVTEQQITKQPVVELANIDGTMEDIYVADLIKPISEQNIPQTIIAKSKLENLKIWFSTIKHKNKICASVGIMFIFQIFSRLSDYNFIHITLMSCVIYFGGNLILFIRNPNIKMHLITDLYKSNYISIKSQTSPVLDKHPLKKSNFFNLEVDLDESYFKKK
jgi:hypothetical protein